MLEQVELYSYTHKTEMFMITVNCVLFLFQRRNYSFEDSERIGRLQIFDMGENVTDVGKMFDE